MSTDTKRRSLIDEAGEILKTAKTEGRDMTREEVQKFDELHERADDAPRNWPRSQPRDAVYGNDCELTEPAGSGGFRAMSEDELERRALRPGEDYRDWAVKHGKTTYKALDQFRPHVFLRAMITGERGRCNAVEQRALDLSSGSAGGVPEPLASMFVQAFITASSVFATRARIVPMDSSTWTIASIDALPTAAYLAEGTDQSATDPTLSAKTLTAKTIRALVEASEEVVADSINLSEMVFSALSDALAEVSDAQLLAGAGTGALPLGLLQQIEAVDGDGVDVDATANWTMYSQAVDLLRSNKLRTPMGNWEVLDGVRTAGQRDRLVSAGAGADGQPLRPFPSWDELGAKHVSGAVTEIMAGTAGSRTFSAGTASMSLVGDFSFAYIGVRLDVNLEVNRGGKYHSSYSVGFRGVARNDIKIVKAAAFAPIYGITAT